MTERPTTNHDEMRVLNLFAGGRGGNRELWPADHNGRAVKVTAVEIDPKVADRYAQRYPEDEIVVGDAMHYLLDHHREFEFVWASPVCKTHSRTAFFLKGRDIIRYPDMSLYQVILFLQHFYEGRWCVENVIPYYEPLIKAQKVGRHLLWANFPIPAIKLPNDDVGGMNSKSQKGRDRSQDDRDATHPKLGLHVFECAMNVRQKILIEGLFG